MSMNRVKAREIAHDILGNWRADLDEAWTILIEAITSALDEKDREIEDLKHDLKRSMARELALLNPTDVEKKWMKDQLNK